MSIDPSEFEGQSVLILGNGNSAMETASNLINVAGYIHVASRSPVRLTIATHYVGDVRLTAQVGAVLEAYQLKSLGGFAEKDYDALVDGVGQWSIEFIKGEDGRIRLASKADANVYPFDRAYDRVLRCLGWRFNNTIFGDSVMPEMMALDKANVAAKMKAEGKGVAMAQKTRAVDAQEPEDDEDDEEEPADLYGEEEEEEEEEGAADNTGQPIQERSTGRKGMVLAHGALEERGRKKKKKSAKWVEKYGRAIRWNDGEMVLELYPKEENKQKKEITILSAEVVDCEDEDKTQSERHTGAPGCFSVKKARGGSTVVLRAPIRPQDAGNWVQALGKDGDKLRLRWQDMSEDISSVTPELEPQAYNAGAEPEDSSPPKPTKRSPKYPEITGGYESVNVEDMFFAGTLAHGRDWRKSAGGFIHGFRYTARALFNVLGERFEETEWPHEKLNYHVADVIGMMHSRINEASGIYQMFAELVDVVAIPPDRSHILYYREVPRGYVNSLVPADWAHMTVGFEYGPKNPGRERPSSNHPGRDVFRRARTPFSNHSTGWIGVSELVHPVCHFYYPDGVVLDPTTSDDRAFDLKITSWDATIFVDPQFSTGHVAKENPAQLARFGGYFDSLPDAYRRGVTEVEFHLLEDFATDWTQAHKWEGFFEYFNHVIRDWHDYTDSDAAHWAVGALSSPACSSALRANGKRKGRCCSEHRSGDRLASPGHEAVPLPALLLPRHHSPRCAPPGHCTPASSSWARGLRF